MNILDFIIKKVIFSYYYTRISLYLHTLIKNLWYIKLTKQIIICV